MACAGCAHRREVIKANATKLATSAIRNATKISEGAAAIAARINAIKAGWKK